MISQAKLYDIRDRIGKGIFSPQDSHDLLAEVVAVFDAANPRLTSGVRPATVAAPADRQAAAAKAKALLAAKPFAERFPVAAVRGAASPAPADRQAAAAKAKALLAGKK
jgi:hypothetical protein